MECERLPERRHVEITAFACLVGSMQSYAEIATDHKHRDVNSQAGTCTKCYIFQEGLGFELATRTVWIIFKQPDVTGVNEEGTMQDSDDREAVFQIGFKFESTRLVEVAVDKTAWGAITAGAD